jgi:hypothetical protein
MGRPMRILFDVILHYLGNIYNINGKKVMKTNNLILKCPTTQFAPFLSKKISAKKFFLPKKEPSHLEQLEISNSTNIEIKLP